MAAIRLLILIGCRKREILHLRWDQVDFEAAELVLPKSKTGPRKVSLSPRAVRVLESIERVPDNPWVVPGRVEGRPMRSIDEAWGVVCELAALRTHASTTAGTPSPPKPWPSARAFPMIGKLLGHPQVQTTARYAHLARDTVKASASRAGDSIGEALASAEQ